ncbi:unnamed protein product, partial [Heterosigma akashiwo]
MPSEKKIEYFSRMEGMIETYTKCFIVGVDNVGSHQMQQIRLALRGEAEVLMGKNTMMRKVIAEFMKKNPGHPFEQISAKLRGNVGLVFTNGDLGEVRLIIIEENRVPAPARVGSIAPVEVIVPPGPTGCDPGQTSFFQVLQIATKISRGQIEIVAPVSLLSAGDKVGNSEAALLQKLDIKPFTYGLVIDSIYDNGSLFDAKVLDLTDADLQAKFMAAVSKLASVCLEIGYPTLASMPHSIANAFKKLVAWLWSARPSPSKAEPYKAYLADLGLRPSGAPAGRGGGGTPRRGEEGGGGRGGGGRGRRRHVWRQRLLGGRVA